MSPQTRRCSDANSKVVWVRFPLIEKVHNEAFGYYECIFGGKNLKIAINFQTFCPLHYVFFLN